MHRAQFFLTSKGKGHLIYIVTRRVDYKRGFGLDVWIYCTLYIHTVRDYRQYSAIAILHTLQFTFTHALGFSVFTSRILATDLCLTNFKSHMKSSLHRIIPFLPLFYSIQFRRLDSSTLRVTIRVTLRLKVYRQSVLLSDKPLETHDQ
jgi:hypothetical protein